MKTHLRFVPWVLLCSFLFVLSCDQKGEVIYQASKKFENGHVEFEIPLQESRKEHRIFMKVDYKYVDTNRYNIEVRLTQPGDETSFRNLREVEEDRAKKRPGSVKFSRTRKAGQDEHRVFTFVPKSTGTFHVEAYKDMEVAGATLGTVTLEVRK